MKADCAGVRVANGHARDPERLDKVAPSHSQLLEPD
jgi:hypothetical protein